MREPKSSESFTFDRLGSSFSSPIERSPASNFSCENSFKVTLVEGPTVDTVPLENSNVTFPSAPVSISAPSLKAALAFVKSSGKAAPFMLNLVVPSLAAIRITPLEDPSASGSAGTAGTGGASWARTGLGVIQKRNENAPTNNRAEQALNPLLKVFICKPPPYRPRESRSIASRNTDKRESVPSACRSNGTIRSRRFDTGRERFPSPSIPSPAPPSKAKRSKKRFRWSTASPAHRDKATGCPSGKSCRTNPRSASWRPMRWRRTTGRNSDPVKS